MPIKTKKQFNNFYDAWWWLNETIAFYDPSSYELWDPRSELGLDEEDIIKMGNRFEKSLQIEVVKVNPKTNRREDDETKNTQTAVWLECGEFYYDNKYMSRHWGSYHNIKYDTGGSTFEEAIINLANIVYKNYNTEVKIERYKKKCFKYIEQAIKDKAKLKFLTRLKGIMR